MMTKFLGVALVSLWLVYTAQADTQCNLRAIFKTPRRSNYDEFELMERSNFEEDASRKKQQVEPKLPNAYSNARVLLKLGDYKNAIKKNNNNVNTRITLAGPNHNNYYQPPYIHPYYPPMVPPMGYTWNPYYQPPKAPQYIPQYYVVSPPRYIPRYPAVPPQVPVVNPINIPIQHPSPKPKFVINDPIVLDNSVIQHIPIASIQPKSSISNGLNTMTVIPKILIDTVAKQPALVQKLGTEKPADPTIALMENNTTIEPTSEEPKLENVEQKQPEVQDLKVEEVQPNMQNLTQDKPEIIAEVVPDMGQEVPKDEQNIEIVELLPAVSAEPAANNNLNLPEVDNSVNSPVEDPKEPDVMVEQEIILKDPSTEPAVESINQETPVEGSPIHNMDHPRVLHPVKLSNNIENVEIVGAGNVNISLNGNSQPEIERCKNTKDFEFVDLLKKSLVPFINLKTNEEPKLLVSYPVVNSIDKDIPEHPSAIIVESLRREPTFCAACSNCGNSRKKDVDMDHFNIFKIAPMISQEVLPGVQESSSGYSVSSSSSSQTFSSPDGTPKTVVSGYQISSGSGYYEDPTRKVVYRKPTEITVVPPQYSHVVPSSVEPVYVPHHPVYPTYHHEPVPIPSGSYIQPRLQPRFGRSRLVDLLKYLLTDLTPAPPTNSRLIVCPYCANTIRIPTMVRCPHCQNYHEVPRAYSSPGMIRSFCTHCMAAKPIRQQFWNPPKSACPYCAKYVGELNQLSV